MSELGVFAVDRGVFDHPVFQSREPLSKREAWLWLLAEASWKERVKAVPGASIRLRRGQLSHSIRFMASAWRWDKAKVGRFLERLRTETMIETAAETGQTVVTICKYDDYQRVSLPTKTGAEAASQTEPRQERDKLEDIQTIQEGSMSEATASPSPPKPKARNDYTPDYLAFWEVYPATTGQSKLDGFKAWKKLSAEQKAQAMASLPAYADLLKRNPDRPVKHVQGYLNGRMFESFGSAPSQAPDWAKRLTYGRQRRQWPAHQWGPIPGRAGCQAPADLLQPDDGEGWSAAREAT